MRLSRNAWLAQFALFAGAVFAVWGYGRGLIVADSYSELHLDPIGFFARMRFAWDTQIYLGTHTGWMRGYECPYGWSYALLAMLHVPSALAEHAVVFAIEWTISVAMYLGLRSLEPRLPRFARVCGAWAYLFSIYVAFDLGNGYSSFLLPYAMTPVVLGVAASVLRGRTNAFVGGGYVAIAVLVAGGVNPPLLVILAIVATLYVVLDVAMHANRPARLRRASAFCAASVLATLVLNAYWIVPFLDYGRTFWSGSQLDESPVMHNIDTSFANVWRGFGQWGIFRSDSNGPWFPWAASFVGGSFYAISWAIPSIAFASLFFRRVRTPFAAYCAVLAAVSVPIVVGYHSGPNGPALTQPLYDLLYSHLPGFQIFRSAYKWVWPLEFAVAGLFATAVAALAEWARSFRSPASRALVAATVCILCALPVASFVPMIVWKENHSTAAVPAWYGSAQHLVGQTPGRRVALLPSQYVPQYDWADQAFYIENSFLQNDLVAGYISGAPNEGSHLWLTRAYRAAREGRPEARDAFRLLGASRVLARDDFRSASDFAYVGENGSTDTTESHDVASSVLDGRPVSSNGALRAYALASPLPDVYVSQDPVLSPLPAVSIASSADPASFLFGNPVVSADDVPAADLQRSIAAGLELPSSGDALDGLAATETLSTGTIVTSVAEDDAFRLPRSAGYEMFELGLPWMPKTLAENSLLAPEQIASNLADPRTFTVDEKAVGESVTFEPRWTHVAHVDLGAGWHVLRVRRAALRPFVEVAFVETGAWRRERKTLARLAAAASRSADFTRIDDRSGRLTLAPGGRYRVRGTGAIVSSTSARDADVPASALVIDPGFASLSALRGSVEIPYIPADGVVTTAYRLLPKSWYDDPETFSWNRGDVTQWALFERTARLRVYSPAADNTVARVRMRLAPVGVSSRFDVQVGGQHVTSFVLTSSGAPGSDELERRGPLGVRPPVEVTFSISLRRGLNDVSIRANRADAIPANRVDRDIASDAPVVAAMVGDASFTLETTRSPPRAAIAVDESTAPISLPLGPIALEANPLIVGRSAFHEPGAGAWLAELVRYGGVPSKYRYRVSPIDASGAFRNSVAALLPNGFGDGSETLVRAWVVFTGERGSAYAVRASDAIANVHVERDRSARFTRSVAFVRRAVDVTLDDERVAHVAIKESHLAGISISGTHRGRLRAYFMLRLPPAAFSRFDATIKAYDVDPNVRVEIRSAGSWQPVGVRARIVPAVLAQHGNLTLMRLDLPVAIRPTGAELAGARFLFRIRGEFVDCSEDAATIVRGCVPTYAYDGRVASLAVLVRGTAPSSVDAVVPEFATLEHPSSYRLSITRPELRGSSDVRIVADGTLWTGAKAPVLLVVDPRIEGPASSALRLSVDGATRSGDVVLGSGEHIIASADPTADLASVGVTPTSFRQLTEPSMVERRSPVALDVTLAPTKRLELLVLNESFHPEWRAEAALAHVQVDGFANGWLVAPHPHPLVVRVRFDAQRLFDGSLLVTLLGAAFAVVAVVAVLRRR